MPCARGGPGGAPPRRVAILLSLLGGWHDNRYPMHLWRRCGVFARRRAGRVVCCARSGAIRITLLFRLATLARLHGSSISICSRPSALRPPVPSLSTVECTHSGVPVRSMSIVHHYTQPSQAAHTQNTQPHFTQTTHTSHVLLYMLTPQCEGGALCLHSILSHSCFISHSFGFIILIRWTTAPRPIRDVLLAAFLEEPISLQLFERIRRDCSCV